MGAPVPGTASMPARWGGRRRGLRRRREALQRGLEVALGVDQEVGARHHALARLQARQHLDAVAEAAAQSDLARGVAARGRLNEHDLPRAAVDHGGRRHAQHVDRRAGHLDLAEQAGPQPTVAVRQFHTHVHRACRDIDQWLHERHPAAHGFADERGGGECRRLAGRD